MNRHSQSAFTANKKEKKYYNGCEIEFCCNILEVDMGIVAEGVETLQQIERLRELGVTAAQGFIFAPALPGDVFIELTKKLAPEQEEEIDAAGEADEDALFDEADGEPGAASDADDDFFDEEADGEADGESAEEAGKDPLENAA